MRKFTPKRGLVMLFSLLFLTIMIPVFLAHATSTVVSVSPTTVDCGIGGEFTVRVIITDVTDLYGWEFRLQWNPTLLDILTVVEDQFLKSGGSTFFSYKVDSNSGRMIADCTLLGAVSGVSGGGTLTTLTFYVKSAGSSSLDLYNGVLLNSSEQPISFEMVDGEWHSASYHDVSITEVSFSPESVLRGQLAQVNVTVRNEGSSSESFNVTACANSEVFGVQLVSLASGAFTVVQFSWNTLQYSEGEYFISASVTILPGETDIADNTRTADSKFTILPNNHDLAIANIIPYRDILGNFSSTSIEVTVVNRGSIEENLALSLFYNSTLMANQTVILPPNQSVSIIFDHRTPITCGLYSVIAMANPVLGETETSDNILNYDFVRVSIKGDINTDYVVNIIDISKAAAAFESSPTHARWDPNCDINEDRKINIIDISAIAKEFGKQF